MDAGSNPKDIAKIYDKYDNADKGFVNYGGWLNESGGTPTATSSTGSILLTNSGGTEQLNFASGSTLYIKVTDADRNTSTSSAQTFTATVKSETETTAESLTLTETGANTGIFMGSIAFEVAAASNGDGKLQVAKGDKLTGTYIDPADDFGNEKTVTDLAFYSVSLVTGTISTNTTWTKANSPYLITGDVTVNENKTLTIEPGAKVRFVPISDDQSSGDDINRSELRIRGILRAVGTSSDSILFTSNAETPAAGDWYGIRVYDSGSKAFLDYCRIEYNTYGIRASGYNSSKTDTISVSHSLFQNGGTALNHTSGSYRRLFFNNNTVKESDAIYSNAYFYYAQVKNNTVTNGRVYLQTEYEGATAEISNNTFTATKYTDTAIGVYAYA
jgi:hypothetical protein